MCRVLDAANHLLGWTEVQAEARGDGKLWTTEPVTVLCDAGHAEVLSIHWCDVNVETRVPFVADIGTPTIVRVYPAGTPVITVGEMPGPLPPVTVRSTAVGIPVGQMGARG